MNKVAESFARHNMISKSWRIKRTVDTDANASSGNTQVWCSGLTKNNTWILLNNKQIATLVVTQLQHVLDVVCNLLTNKSVHC
jgi:hypothetical protein